MPRARLFPADAEINEWLRSSSVIVGGTAIGHINARLRNDGGVEFAFTPTNGQRILPLARVFPVDVTHNRWLHSTEIELLPPDDSGLRLPTRAAMKDALVVALFRLANAGEADRLTSHDYNDWGCGVSGTFEADCDVRKSEKAKVRARVQRRAWNAYGGGHGGWDIDHSTPTAEFRSLTAGVVIAAGVGECRDIAVYDADANRTTVYLHASSVTVVHGATVAVGDSLGRQGASCANGGFHLHIEVRVGEVHGQGKYYARGAGLESGRPLRCGEISVDPLPYLYWSVSGRQGPQPSAGYNFRPPAANGTCLANGDLVSADGSPDVFVIRLHGGKWFKRKVVAYGLYQAVRGWDERNVRSVTDRVLSEIVESPLIRIPGDAKNVYVVEETGEDDIVLRHIPSEAIFNSAGCDWDGVFAMSTGEYNYWSRHVGDALDGGRTGDTFECPE